MPITRKTLFNWAPLLLACVVLAGGCATVPSTYRPAPALSAEARRVHHRAVFDRAWTLVHERFFDAKFRGVDWVALAPKYRAQAEAAGDEEALYEVINTMLGELKESHNVAFSPRAAFERVTHQRARVGLRLRRLESRWVVTEVLPGSPAEASGVRPGWIIVRRNGQTLDAKPDLLMEVGETVTYEFLDAQDQPRTVPMVARLLSTADQHEVRLLDHGLVYLRFDGFDRTSRRWFSQQLKTHRDAPGVVIDLRQNPGGQAFSLLLTLGEVFPQSVPMGAFIRRSGREDELDSLRWSPARYEGRLAVLIDQSTGSCSEIFAHVLQYHHRATLIGRKTAGAVIASRYFSLPDGGSLQVGVQDYHGLDGQRLEDKGVTPDRTITLRLEDLRRGYDADLTAAVEELQR